MSAPPLVLQLIAYAVRRLQEELGAAPPPEAPVFPGEPEECEQEPVGVDSNQRVIAIGNNYSGGGYNTAWTGSGFPEVTTFTDKDGKSATGAYFNQAAVGGTFCCGFTFGVAMKVAAERGLLKDKSAAEVKQFMVNWSGHAANDDKTKPVYWEQCTLALEELGIGTQVADDPNLKPAGLPAAQPGDFVQFWRGDEGSGGGHSVIFLGYEKNAAGEVIGIKYRSSQPNTDGIGDRVEYLEGAKDEKGKLLKGPGQKSQIDPEKVFAGRLNDQ